MEWARASVFSRSPVEIDHCVAACSRNRGRTEIRGSPPPLLPYADRRRVRRQPLARSWSVLWLSFPLASTRRRCPRTYRRLVASLRQPAARAARAGGGAVPAAGAIGSGETAASLGG